MLRTVATSALGYRYEEEGQSSGLTALGGLPPYLELAHLLGIPASIEQHLSLCQSGQGFTASEMVLSLTMLQLAGGDCVEDLTRLAADEGFLNMVQHLELSLAPREQRPLIRKRQRRERSQRRRGILPSPTTAFRFLAAFHNPGEEAKRAPEKAFIPAPNPALQGLAKVNADSLARVAAHLGQEAATLDADATLIESHKKQALPGYKGFKAYQPLNFYWAELGMVLYGQFRDGNVPAAYGQLAAFKEALELLPPNVRKVYLRADTASYEHDLLKYLARGSDPRFGVIEFAVSADVSPELRQAIEEVAEGSWRPLLRKVGEKVKATGQEWAWVDFVPTAICDTKKDEGYRYLAIRELLPRQPLPAVDPRQLNLPFPTARLDPQKRVYKVTAVVTNRQLPGDELIWWHRQHCGYDEHSHSELKSALGGGQLPSGDFGANAAWWSLALLAFNLNQAMKRLVLGGDWVTKRLKAMRLAIINLPARVIPRARGLVIRLTAAHPSNRLLGAMYRGLAKLARCLGVN